MQLSWSFGFFEEAQIFAPSAIVIHNLHEDDPVFADRMQR